MSKTFICKNCDKEKPVNIRLIVPQQYCGDAPCQRARKAEWQRQKKATDAKYRARQQQCVKQWQQNKPLHRYLSQYRQDHPDYVAQNRDKQKLRNQKRRLEHQQQKIVKMDAFVKQLEKSTTYVMTPYQVDASQKIVKMDPLLVQLTVVHGNRAALLSNWL
jgi:hypothetical protein